MSLSLCGSYLSIDSGNNLLTNRGNWLTNLVFGNQFWTESFVQWSPLGTYLATIHRQGAAVWGGEKSFNRLMRYIHPQVCLMLFGNNDTIR